MQKKPAVPGETLDGELGGQVLDVDDAEGVELLPWTGGGTRYDVIEPPLEVQEGRRARRDVP